jgi:multiple sugar transport system substrate-binding protein
MRTPLTAIFSALAAASLSLSVTVLHAQDFKGYTLKVKLVGGAPYQPLYDAVIPGWERKTGARVEVLSKKTHFDLDKEIKQDIAARKINFCVGSNHTSFSPQYGDLYRDLRPLFPAAYLSQFNSRVLQHSVLGGALVQLPRHSDVSALYYNKLLFNDPDNRARYKAKFGKELAPPQTWTEFSQQAQFFSNPPTVYGTQFPGKEEPLTGRFYEMLVAEGGQLFDKNWHPAFNSESGVRALNFFIDLYKAGVVPKNVNTYNWDELGAGFASGKIALDLDWGGWGGSFNDPKNSKIANQVGITQAPKGPSGKRTGWAGSHSFSITRACDNPKVAADFLMALTSLDAQLVEARLGLTPTRIDAAKQGIAEFNKKGDNYMVQLLSTFSKSMAEDSFTPPLTPEWIEVSNAIWPELQSAIFGNTPPRQALDVAAKKVEAIMLEAGRLR